MKLIKVCIAMAAFAALFVVPSMASAVSPELFQTTETGNHKVPVGTPIIATNVAHAGTALTTKLVSGVGNIECETATLTGELTKNDGGIEGNITTAEFRGTPPAPNHPNTAHCQGGFGGNTVVTPNHTSDEIGSLPWCVKAGAEDSFTVRGGKCSEAAKALKFRLDTSTLGKCTYERSTATGPVSGTYTTHPADAIMTIQNQGFKKIEGSVFCPSEGALFMAFTITTDNGGISGAALNVT